MLRTALALQALHAIAMLGSWLVSPSRVTAWLFCLSYLLVTALLSRHRAWVGGMATPARRWLTTALWYAPGLLCGAGSLALFLGVPQLPSIIIFLLQLWLQPFAPLLSLTPNAAIDGIGLYLWISAATPLFLFAATGICSGGSQGNPSAHSGAAAHSLEHTT
jgi:hypothetical protein